MKKDKDREEISSEQKLEEVIRQKKTESEALKKLFASLENAEKDLADNKQKKDNS